jgi:hypothetical protein
MNLLVLAVRFVVVIVGVHHDGVDRFLLRNSEKQ